MKTVNMLDLAKVISDDIEIVGARPGEKLNETLVSEKELPFTTVKDKYVFIHNEKKDKKYNLPNIHSSLTAEKMPIEEMKQLIQ